jgi:hypothetical protein
MRVTVLSKKGLRALNLNRPKAIREKSSNWSLGSQRRSALVI